MQTDPEPKPIDDERPMLLVERLSKVYTTRRGWFRRPQALSAVDEVTLYIRKGETLGLMGESGCGKSTLSLCIAQLEEPTFGRVSLDGQDITWMGARQLRPLRRRFQLILQDPQASLDPRMTIGDCVAEGLDIHGLCDSKEARSKRIAELLGRVGLSTDLATRLPEELSTGQRQRVCIARALALDPDVLLCDEPVSALDACVKANILNLFKDLQQQGKSLLFVSHDVGAIDYLAQRVAVMYAGRIVEMGKARDVLDHPAHPYTRALLSAVPSMDPTAGRLRIVLEGEPPDPKNLPTGCVFHPRCPFNDHDRCARERPTLSKREDDSNRRVACWHPITAT